MVRRAIHVPGVVQGESCGLAGAWLGMNEKTSGSCGAPPPASRWAAPTGERPAADATTGHTRK